MNFKRNCLAIITLTCSALVVTSCQDRNSFNLYHNIAEVSDTHEEFVADDGSFKKPGDFKTYKALSGTTEVELGTTYETLTEYTGRNILKAEGDRKLLVVPVQFSDFTISSLGISPDEYITNLNKAFFGTSRNNKYVSVAEYYNRSSYGKLRISGKVCDQFFTYPNTVAEITQNKSKYTRNRVLECYNKVLSWYQDTYHESLDEYRINPEDENSDVAIYLVYTYPIDWNKQDSQFFWAFTFQDKPLSWSSYSFINTISGYPDAHTYIHETGHLLGLVDYYPNEENESTTSVYEPAGRIDMMDCSVGDHTGLSKMMLNWARPYWVTGQNWDANGVESCEITIRSLADSGDLILINDLWNETVFDEYYLIEFYTPTGLNYFDTSIGNNLAKLPTLPGIKIYHVDARLGYYNVENNTKTFSRYYCDEEVKAGVEPYVPKKGNIDIVHDNTTYSKAEDTDFHLKNYLYELIFNNADDITTTTSSCATNKNLFRKGDVFEDLKFNSSKLWTQDYKITVTRMTYRDATIKIEKVKEI